jgi:hypothetical protein
MALLPVGDNMISIYSFPIKSPLDGTELFEIVNQGTEKLYGKTSDIPAGASLAAPLNVLAYGADKTGVADSSTAFRSAISAAGLSSRAPAIYIPSGIYRIDTTVTIPSQIRIAGDGPTQSVLIPHMVDGTSCLKLASSNQFITLRDFGIEGPVSQTPFIAGGAAPNCIGIEGGDTSIGHTTRWRFDNIHIYGCGIGMRINGWIGRMSKVHIDYCDIGFIGLQMNACSLNLHIENCKQDFTLNDTYGCSFDGFMAEGDIASAVSSVMNNCHSVIFTAPYWEWGPVHPRAYPFLSIGTTTPISTSIEILGASISGSSGLAYGVVPISLDNVANGRITGDNMEGPQLRGVSMTANTSGVEMVTINTSGAAIIDPSLSQDSVVNVWPNSRFDHWYRGWGTTYAVRGTASRETTLVRRGPNAVRISSTTGQAYSFSYWEVSGQTAVPLRGKTLRAGVWIWVPNVAGFNEASRTMYPNVYLQSYNGSVATSASFGNNRLAINSWNFCTATLQIQSDATNVGVSVFVNDSANVSLGTEYVVVDSISVVDASSPVQWQRDGMMRDGDMIPKFFNDKMMLSAASYPTDANQTFSAGDQVWSSTPAASTSPGWICVTAGTGATSVWKAMAALGA